MNQNDIAFWGMIGNWFTGLATFLAVIVSLYLSTRQTRIKLKCFFGERIKILGDGTNLGKCIFIEITNLSLMPINIEHQLGIGMITKKRRLRFWRKKKVWMISIDPRNVSGSKNKLLTGENSLMWIDFDKYKINEWYKNMAIKLYTHGVKPNEIECYVYVNNSITYRFPFDSVVLEKLELQYKKIINDR
ncbi:hypothetical protein [Gilliamella sp. W8128]|uniref:hypothetical protein n=1 Tax=Gilliamella sp. W8128 TaxID=2751010 RepID=UPI0018DD6221|nr:hypothetical protein [Gilliamella sp. W8128]MBI0154293.1 hypothetical protein [Gilliamella sp. W8128]